MGPVEGLNVIDCNTSGCGLSTCFNGGTCLGLTWFGAVTCNCTKVCESVCEKKFIVGYDVFGNCGETHLYTMGKWMCLVTAGKLICTQWANGCVR